VVPFSNTDGVWNSFPVQQHALNTASSIVNSNCATHIAEVLGLESEPHFRLEFLKTHEHLKTQVRSNSTVGVATKTPKMHSPKEIILIIYTLSAHQLLLRECCR